VKEDIKCHIGQFQTVSSHYCRRSSDRQYLPESLTLAEMYRMYTSESTAMGRVPAKRKIYSDIFHSCYNVSFHRPKKDLCDLCEKFSRSTVEEQTAMKDRTDEHMHNKMFSRQLKEEEKRRAQTDHSIRAACFDLQQVLATPHSMSSQLYYRRKLATYNLTVFDMSSKQGYCYMWHEGFAKRGANNIASCVWQYIESQAVDGGSR